MSKAPKKQTLKNFERDYNKVMKNFVTPFQTNQQQQWTAPGDFFVKFSILKETSSGATSSNTTFISQ